MSTELINRITVKKDGVYLSSHSSNDTAPFHSWRCKGLSEIYAAEGQKGLDREIISMLYEYAELRGFHRSVERYRYAMNSPEAHAIYKRYTDQIDNRYESMEEADRDSVWYKPTEKERNIGLMSVRCGGKCIPRLLQGVKNTTGNTKTGIMNDKEV